VLYCTLKRLQWLNPDLFKALEHEIGAFSAESLETAHARLAAWRAGSMLFSTIRQNWHNVGSEIFRTILLGRHFRCVRHHRPPLLRLQRTCVQQRCLRLSPERAAAAPSFARAPASVGRHRGKARRYTGRTKLSSNHPLVKKCTAALLEWIAATRATSYTIAPVASSSKMVFRDPLVGAFDESVLLPPFDELPAAAAAALQKVKQEWRKPLKNMKARTPAGEEDDDDAESAADEEQAQTQAHEEAGAAAAAPTDEEEEDAAHIMSDDD
jgi:hypothetical protein